MSPPAAFSGDYVDLRFVKTRSVCQVVIEIDISQATSFVASFGTPMPGTGVPVAIARMQPSETRQQLEASVALLDKPPKERRPWSALSYAEQAGIRCGEPEFWQFINDEFGHSEESTLAHSSESAAEFVRKYCHVDSRSELRPGTEAGHLWERLDSEYESWLRRPTF